MPSQTHGKMKWSLEADQKLLIQLLLYIKDLKIKLNFEELSRAMGPECTESSLEHRIRRLRAMASEDTNSAPPTAAPASAAGPVPAAGPSAAAAPPITGPSSSPATLSPPAKLTRPRGLTAKNAPATKKRKSVSGFASRVGDYDSDLETDEVERHLNKKAKVAKAKKGFVTDAELLGEDEGDGEEEEA